MSSCSFTVTGILPSKLVVSKKPTDSPLELIKELTSSMGIEEFIWFGLEFTDSDDKRSALNTFDKIGARYERLSKPEANIQLKLLYYPDTHARVIQTKVKHMMVQNCVDMIRSEKIYCPPEMVLNLVAHNLQLANGDFDDLTGDKGMEHIRTAFQTEIPNGMKTRIQVNQAEWENSIKKLWRSLGGYHLHDTLCSYLDQVEQLQMYNIHYFDITNEQGTALALGVEATGLSIFYRDDPQSPLVSFDWKDLSEMDYKGSNIVLTLSDQSTKDSPSKLTFRTDGAAQGYRIGASVRSFFMNYIQYYNADKMSKRFKEMKKSAEVIAVAEAKQRKQDVENNLERYKQKLAKAIEEVKKSSEITAKRAEKSMEKVVALKEGVAEQLYKQLKELNKFLSEQISTETGKTLRMNRKEATKLDTIYEDQMKNQVTKHATLAKLRVGNTKSRVEFFEGM